MATNFTNYELLTAPNLNAALDEKADLTTTGPQSFSGQLTIPVVTVNTSLQTQVLVVTGDATFTSPGALIIPIGTSLERPLPPSFGMFRANSTTGTYEVALVNGTWGQLSTTAAATVVATAPANMGAPSFGPSTANAIPVSWTAPIVGTPPFLYTVQYMVAGSTNWITWAANLAGATTSATVSGLLSGTRYDFQIIVQNTAGIATSPTTASTTLGFNSGGPTNLVASSPTSTTVSLAWTGVSTSPVAYQVRYAPANVTTWTNFGAPTSNTSMTVYGLTPNNIYTFQVIAENTSGQYESNTVNATTSGAATLAPSTATNLSFPASTINSITVSWNAPTSGNTPFAYWVQYQVSGTTTWIPYLTPTTAPNVVVTGLNSGTGYVFQVVSINSAGSSTSASGAALTLSASPVVGGVAEYQATSSLPTLSGPILGACTVNSALDNLGVALNDPPAAYLLGSLILTVTCGSGNVTMTDATGNPVSGSGTHSIGSYATTLAGAQIALASLTYTAGSLAGTDSIRISVTDQLTLNSTMVINITVSGVSTVGSPTPTPTPTPSPSPSPSGSSLRTATGQPTDATGTSASNSYDLTARIAVVTRFENADYNAGYTLVQAALIENQINYIGNGGNLRLVRELCAGNMNPSWMGQIAQNCGLFSYILAGDAVQPSLYGIVEANMQTMISTYPNMVLGVEGFDPSYGGVDNYYLSNAAAEQININAIANKAAVFSFQVSPESDGYASVIASANQPAVCGTSRALFQSCPNGPFLPPNSVNGAMYERMTQAKIGNGGVGPFAISQFGYSTFLDSAASVPNYGYVAETVQAKYLLEGIFDAYPMTDYSIAIHELQDANNAYGLFHNDGTPKLAATMLRILFTLMNPINLDFITGNLGYSITGSIPSQYSTFVNTGLRQSLFQNYDGTFMLWLWNEQPLNDSSTNATLSVANVPVTVNFTETAMTTVNIYDPFAGYASNGQLVPYATYSNVTSIPLSLPAWPVCLQITHP